MQGASEHEIIRAQRVTAKQPQLELGANQAVRVALDQCVAALIDDAAQLARAARKRGRADEDETLIAGLGLICIRQAQMDEV